MGRFDTRFHKAPVAIGRVVAAQQQRQLIDQSERVANGAGGYGARELPNAPVPMELRIDKGTGANTSIGIQGTVPLGPTRRKKGYPPISKGFAGAES